MVKEKQISESILKYKLLKERINEIRSFQEKCRKALKTYENLITLNMLHRENKIVQNNIRYFEQIIFENKTLLNALQKQCIAIKKNIKKLDKEQNFRNNKQ